MKKMLIKAFWAGLLVFNCFMYGMFAEAYNHGRIYPGPLWVICGWLTIMSFLALIAPDKK